MIIKKLSINKVKDEKINIPADAVRIAKSLILKEDFCKEHLIVLYLNNKNKVKSAEIVHIGDINSCIVSPSNVFKSAILKDCNSVIMLHNHPSGSLEPSTEDINTFKDLKMAGEILKIKMLDSIIFNEKGESFSLENY